MNNMKVATHLLLSITNSEKIIKNFNIPACKNCIYYKPNTLYGGFTSPFNKCTKFGEKDIITGKITYNYADDCRNDEAKCGKEGKYFEEEKNIHMKELAYRFASNLPIIGGIILGCLIVMIM
jgi:hypothetical protein